VRVLRPLAAAASLLATLSCGGHDAPTGEGSQATSADFDARAQVYVR
jgi:hypothetical protein